MDAGKHQLLAKVASLYYQEGLTQGDIARKTGYSPSMISRLLEEARKQGIVEIRIHYPIGRRPDLEQELQDLLGLRQVQVMTRGTLDHPEMLRQLGSLAARLMEDLVRDDMTIGTAWGPAVYETVGSLRPGTCSGVHVVQMIGSQGAPEPQIDGQDLARRIAKAFVGHYTVLPVPSFLENELTRQSLMKEPQVQRAMDQFRSIELALAGIGTLDPERSSMLRVGFLSLREVEELQLAGAVGDVVGVYYDRYGNVLDVPLTRRTIGIDPATLSAIPTKIGVAGGQSKVWPIIGASRARFVDILVTDEVAASGILRELRGVGKVIDGQQSKADVRNGKRS